MGSIDTDPASSDIANQRVQAKTYYTQEDDGLTKEWSGNVWMNPPYAQPLIKHFSDAIVEKYNNAEFDQACVLVNNATETAWFQNMLKIADGVCFVSKRIKFLDTRLNPVNTPLQGQAMLYFGDDFDSFKTQLSDIGVVMRHG